MGNDRKPDGNCSCSVISYEASNLNAEQPTIDPTTRTRARPFASPEEAEKLTYESYLRTMHQTSVTSTLSTYPPPKKLHTQLVKYPQYKIRPNMTGLNPRALLSPEDSPTNAHTFPTCKQTNLSNRSPPSSTAKPATTPSPAEKSPAHPSARATSAPPHISPSP